MTKQEYINRVMLIMNEAGLYDKEGNSYIGADSAQVDRYIEGSYVDAWRRCAQVFPKAWFENGRFDDCPHVENLADGTGYIVLPSDFYLLNTFKLKRWRKPIFEAFVENERTSSIQSNEWTRGSEIRPVGTMSTEYITQFTRIDFYQSGHLNPPIDNDGLHPEDGLNLLWFNTDDNMLYSPIKVMGEVFVWAPCSLDGINKGHLFRFDEQEYVLVDISSSQELTLDPISISQEPVQVLNYYSVQKGLLSHEIEKAIYIPVAKNLSKYSNDDELGLDHRIIEPMAYLSASSVFTIFEKYETAKALEMRVIEMFPAFKSVKGTNVTFKQ